MLRMLGRRRATVAYGYAGRLRNISVHESLFPGLFVQNLTLSLNNVDLKSDFVHILLFAFIQTKAKSADSPCASLNLTN